MNELSDAQKKFYEIQPAVDCEDILNRAKACIEHADELTEFEADFLLDLVRMANLFKENLRLSKKQIKLLGRLWDKYVLPEVVKNKIK